MSGARPGRETGVILPAYNVVRHLPDVIEAIGQAQPLVRVLVVDDGSVDGTADAARTAGAEVLVHPQNRDKGGALASGFTWALDVGLEWVYTMDADGQHLPHEMAHLWDAARDDAYDVIVGNRMDRTADMPWLRKRTNEFTSWVVSRLAGVRIPDSQSGYRLLRVACLQDMRLRTSRYDTESEVLVRLARRGCRIGSAPISTVYGDQHSSINPLIDTVRFFRLVAVLLASRKERERTTRHG
jgi:glycosyltransferase involved in cell wall biosynthesis